MAIREGDLMAIPGPGTLPSLRLDTEAWTRSVLDSLPATWRLLHERQWPGRSYETIDHVAVGPTGVFVIDRVRWNGPVEISPDDLKVNARHRIAAIQQAHDTAREIALLLPTDLRDHVFPVICLAREVAISGWVKAVRVCSTVTLDRLIETRDPVLDEGQISLIHAELDSALQSIQVVQAERLRASDAAPIVSEARRPSVGVPTKLKRWQRSRKGKAAEGALGLALVASLVGFGVHAVAVGTDGSNPSQTGTSISP